ncbi:MAG: YgaP family membrane protein [Spirochaetota bacterium]
MTSNVGKADKIVRYLISVVFIVLIIAGVVEGALAVLLGIAALVLSATAAISFCGLYTVLGITTRPKSAQEQ